MIGPESPENHQNIFTATIVPEIVVPGTAFGFFAFLVDHTHDRSRTMSRTLHISFKTHFSGTSVDLVEPLQ